jgi:cell division septation protein DedD
VKSLYNKKGQRRGEGERGPFAFFAVGAVVVLAAVFVIGLQVGRVIEKGAAAPESRGGKSSPASDIRKDLGSFSEETLKVPVVPPPFASSDLNEVEKKLTFQETLAKKEATTVPLVRPAQKDNAASRGSTAAGASDVRRYSVQAGSFREKKAAEAFRKRLDKAGYAVRIVAAAKKDRGKVFRVVAGPYPDVETARKAVRRLKNEMKIDAFLTQGEPG